MLAALDKRMAITVMLPGLSALMLLTCGTLGHIQLLKSQFKYGEVSPFFL